MAARIYRIESDDLHKYRVSSTKSNRGRTFIRFNVLSVDMFDLTGFQRDLLYVIAGLDEPHGLAIKEELEAYYTKEVHHGRLYPNLDTLVEEGYVEKGKVDRRTNFYRLSEWGLGELEARRRWEDERLGTTIST